MSRQHSYKIASACWQQTLHFTNHFSKPRKDGDSGARNNSQGIGVSVFARAASSVLNYKYC